MIPYETRAEQLIAEACYNERNKYREKLVSKLSDLLNQNADSHAIVKRLKELGFKTEKDFTEKTADEMREGIRELIDYLKEASNSVSDVTIAVGEDIAAATGTTAEKVGDKDIRVTLEQLTGGRFLSVEAMNEALQSLKGVNVEIPKDEIDRLNKLFPSKLSKETLAELEKVKHQTEEEKGPLIMQLPAKVMVDGQEEAFTIAIMQEIMRKAVGADDGLNLLCLSDYVTDDVKNKVWDSALTVWTSACLKGSSSKNYQDQLRHQDNILGMKCEIDADMILAMALGYISGKEELMLQDSMRLNTKDADGDPLHVYVYRGDLYLCSSRNCTDLRGGIGASFRIKHTNE